MSDLYTASAFADAAGITYRQLDYWTHRGYLKPVEINGGNKSGTGNSRVFDKPEVLKARVLAALVNPLNASVVADELARNGCALIGEGLMLTLDIAEPLADWERDLLEGSTP